MKINEFKEAVLVEEYFPEKAEEGKIYYSEQLKMVSFLCPCGCGNRLHCRMEPFSKRVHVKDEQLWDIKLIPNLKDSSFKITLYPSVRSLLKCKSHFFIRQNKIIWV